MMFFPFPLYLILRLVDSGKMTLKEKISQRDLQWRHSNREHLDFFLLQFLWTTLAFLQCQHSKYSIHVVTSEMTSVMCLRFECPRCNLEKEVITFTLQGRVVQSPIKLTQG